MILKLILIMLGYILMVYGISYIIIYINLFSFGYTIKEYFMFLYTTFEGYLLPLGMIIEVIALTKRKDKRK